MNNIKQIFLPRIKKFYINNFQIKQNSIFYFFDYYFMNFEIHKKNKKQFFLRILLANELNFCYLIYRHSFSNIFITLLTFWGKVIYTNSGGQVSFATKQTKRAKTNPDTVIALIRKVIKKIRKFNYDNIIFFLRSKPRFFSWNFFISEFMNFNIYILDFYFFFPIAHNGCRARKLRRV